MVFFFSVLTFLSAFLGGLIGLRFKDKLHLILGFTAGILLGVVAFDLLPEIFAAVSDLQIPITIPMTALVIGFLLFHIFEKSVVIHHAQEDVYGKHKHPMVGVFSALAIIAHSFLDGMGIGLAFQISSNIGLMVGLAVIFHNFSDGLNTVSLILSHHNPQSRAKYFLVLDALAPVAGILATQFFSLPAHFVPLYLGFFAGFLLYISASDILPEAHSERSSYQTILFTVFGVALIFLVTNLAR